MNEVAPITAAVTPVPAHLDQHKLAELAYELARNLKPPAEVYKFFGITEDQFKEHIDPNPWFKRVLEAAMIEWASTGSTKTRIQMQAMLALEQGIIPLTARMMDDESDLGKAVEVAKLLAKVAGLDTPAQSGNPGEKFTIQINLGADQSVKIEKEINPAPAPPEQEGGASPVLEITQGEGGAEAV
jgi:hypothetical protein